ncbi:MAG TPA: RNA methyltransferase [Candidatus Paceibacterota bacterium]|nr:RNA methyltransferase [Candidatus Paceibacterota bacterium]
MREVAVLLHNIRSAHNVGSIFRTADAAGVSKIFLSGYTPLPVDRFGYARKDISKVALGAEKSVPWEYQKNPYGIVATLRGDGWQIVGVEQDKNSINYRTLRPKRRVLFILGNEVRGVSPALRKKCDALVEIPMHGKKESLNVAVAAGIVLFSLVQ